MSDILLLLANIFLLFYPSHFLFHFQSFPLSLFSLFSFLILLIILFRFHFFILAKQRKCAIVHLSNSHFHFSIFTTFTFTFSSFTHLHKDSFCLWIWCNLMWQYMESSFISSDIIRYNFLTFINYIWSLFINYDYSSFKNWYVKIGHPEKYCISLHNWSSYTFTWYHNKSFQVMHLIS